MEPDLLDIECRTKPAVHRYPSSMAKRIQALCQHIVDNYDGDASLLWGSATSGADLKQRLVSLPGYGDEKAMIFTAILAKRMGVAPAGWQDAAGPFSDNTPRSVADIDGPEALATVREWKKAQKAVGKSKQQ
jgi:uncharacterized HhH-GPD family protein